MTDIFEQEQERDELPPAVLKLMIAFDDAVDNFAPTSVEAISAAANILSVSLIRHFKERRPTVPEALMRAFMKQLYALVELTMNDGGTARLCGQSFDPTNAKPLKRGNRRALIPSTRPFHNDGDPHEAHRSLP